MYQFKNIKRLFIFSLLFLSAGIINACNQSNKQAEQTLIRHFKEITLGEAGCKTTDSTLIISTGALRRIYKFTPRGMRTVELDLSGAKTADRNNDTANRQADWDLGLQTKATLRNISAQIDDDSGFTSKHITVITDYDYAAAGIRLRYKIWVYPGSGIRTQIELKALHKDKQSNVFNNHQVEYLPLALQGAAITAFGYYNSTQHRDMDSTPILKEEQVPSDADVNWANGLIIGYKTNGFILVKESHKCVNQPGVATGGFSVRPEGIAVTGLGLARKDLDTGGYKTCWASWIVPYQGDTTDGMLALKMFDRLRYPVGKRGEYIMANTWGSSDNTLEGQGRYASRQENVLKEIASQAALGIEVQEIDDGWQGLTYKHWRPASTAVLTLKGDSSQQLRYNIYPDGWNNVKQYASQKGIRLGLWASWVIPEEDLKWNYDHGGFNYFKIDFSSLNTKEKLDNLMAKIRSFILYTHHQVKINWDVTENAPRVGYFYGREYGNISLENRKPSIPENAIYKPHLVLRDFWQVSKFINLNQFQIPIQNVDRVNRQESDAHLYTSSYAAAMSLMGSPLFFGLTQLYSLQDRERMKRILKVYKQQRNKIFKGYVFPIGDVPDNASWTGFQDYILHADRGYLLIFRELHNKKITGHLQLKFIHDQYVELTNLFTGRKEKVLVDKKGLATFTIDKPADFRFYSYRIVSE